MPPPVRRRLGRAALPGCRRGGGAGPAAALCRAAPGSRRSAAPSAALALRSQGRLREVATWGSVPGSSHGSSASSCGPGVRRLRSVGGVPCAPWAVGAKGAGGERCWSWRSSRPRRTCLCLRVLESQGHVLLGIPSFHPVAALRRALDRGPRTKMSSPPPPTFNVGFKGIKSDAIRGLRIASSTFPSMCPVLWTALACVLRTGSCGDATLQWGTWCSLGLHAVRLACPGSPSMLVRGAVAASDRGEAGQS